MPSALPNRQATPSDHSISADLDTPIQAPQEYKDQIQYTYDNEKAYLQNTPNLVHHHILDLKLKMVWSRSVLRYRISI